MDELRLSDALNTGRVAGTSAPAARADRAGESLGSQFVDKLGDAIRSADRDQKAAEAHANSMAKGEGDVVETMIQLSRADVSLRFVVQLRNRALEAYQEIMRLPL